MVLSGMATLVSAQVSDTPVLTPVWVVKQQSLLSMAAMVIQCFGPMQSAQQPKAQIYRGPGKKNTCFAF